MARRIPRRTSLPGIEKANTLANAGAKCTMIGIDRNTIRKCLRSKETEIIAFDCEPSLRRSKTLLGSSNIKRFEQRFLIGIPKDHYGLRAKQNKPRIMSNALYRYCESVPKTPKHILVVCPGFSLLRSQLIK